MAVETEIVEILKSKRLDPTSIPILEKHVESQIKGTWNLEIALALLKLYQFYPDKKNSTLTCQILLKSLTALPDSDFNLCCALLGEDTLNMESIQTIWQMHQLLQQCKFGEFWKFASTSSSLIQQCPGFEDDVRGFITKILSSAYQSGPLKTLASSLNLDESSAKSFLEKRGWTGDKEMIAPVSRDNSAKPVMVQENIKFEQLTKLIGFTNVVE